MFQLPHFALHERGLSFPADPGLDPGEGKGIKLFVV